MTIPLLLSVQGEFVAPRNSAIKVGAGTTVDERKGHSSSETDGAIYDRCAMLTRAIRRLKERSAR